MYAGSAVRRWCLPVDLVGVEHVAPGSDFDGSVQTPFDATGPGDIKTANQPWSCMAVDQVLTGG
jgi:microsomal dipeptidase-like Zn-dependent dipeptidase